MAGPLGHSGSLAKMSGLEAGIRQNVRTQKSILFLLAMESVWEKKLAIIHFRYVKSKFYKRFYIRRKGFQHMNSVNGDL